MKKKISMLAALCLVLGLSACGPKESTADFHVQDAMDAMLAAAPIDDPLTLEEGDMLDFFGIKAEDMAEFAAVTCSNGTSAQEIVLVKAADEDKAAQVETSLQTRLENRKSEAEGYMPEELAIMEQCEVKRDGLYVSLIISPEAEQLTGIYQEYLSGKR